MPQVQVELTEHYEEMVLEFTPAQWKVVKKAVRMVQKHEPWLTFSGAIARICKWYVEEHERQKALHRCPHG